MVISKFDIVPLQLKSLNGGHIFLNLFNTCSIDLQKLQQYFYAYIFDICTSEYLGCSYFFFNDKGKKCVNGFQ